MTVPRPKVRCEICERRTNRRRQDDGSYGVCLCGGRLRRTTSTADQQRAKARAELAEQAG